MAFRIWLIAGAAALALVVTMLISMLGDEDVDDRPEGGTDGEVVRDDGGGGGGGGDGVKLGSHTSRPGSRASGSGVTTVRPRGGPKRSPRGKTPEDDPRDALDLAPGNSEIVVLAIDDQGQAFSGIDITLRAESGNTRKRGSREIETNGKGEAIFDGIPPGTYSIGVVATGRPDLASARQVSVGPGVREVVELRVGDFDLSIAGRIIDTSGEPIAGLVVQARAYAAGGSRVALVPASSAALHETTDEDGRYEIKGLDEGEYEVSTVETKQYPPVSRVVRAGLQSANFVVEQGVLVRVFGVVVDGASEEPLEGVRVAPLGFGSRQTATRENGSFEVFVPLRSAQTVYTVEFLLDGYSTDRRSLRSDELREIEEWQIDVGLAPLDSETILSGVLVGSDGSALPGETIHVHSASQRVRSRGVSDRQGRFEIAGVQPASDYRVWVYPSGFYRDLIRDKIVVPEGGLDLGLELEALGQGSLSGRIVDAEGQPVPHFNLWVNSTSALNKPRQVSSDAAGEFVVESVPAGELIFQTRSLPRFTVRGFRLEEGQDGEVELVLDWGVHDLVSRVLDPDGEPVAVVRVDLYWQQSWGSGRTTSYRNSQTDRDGLFHFTQLGPGKHNLRVTAKGFRGKRIELDIGTDEVPEEIELEK